MPQTDAVFAGSIPAFYDRYLAPLLFEPYAADLARRLADLRSGRVLETAAGTGIVTRMLIQTLPEAVAIVATDLNQPMLDFAAAQPGRARVESIIDRRRDLPLCRLLAVTLGGQRQIELQRLCQGPRRDR